MANYTSNYLLTKPAYTDTADIADINGNMDKVDTALHALGGGLAIMSYANQHAAISKDQYVYIYMHANLAEGLYKALSNISANATLNSSNVQAVSGGLGSAITTLNDQIGMAQDVQYTLDGETKTASFVKTGRIVAVTIPGIGSKTINAWANVYVLTIPSGYRPTSKVRFMLIRQSATTFVPVYYTISTDGSFVLENQSSSSQTTGEILPTILTWYSTL